MDPLEPTKLYCNAFRTLKRRAENGHELTVSEIEDAIEADPPTRKVFAEIAAEVRAGSDPTVAEIATRARMPADFVAFCVAALIGNLAIGLRQETIN